MDDSLAVRVVQCIENVFKNRQHSFRLEPVDVDDLVKVRTLDKLHDEKQMPLFGLPELINRDNVRMGQVSHRLGFQAESFGKLAIPTHLQRHQFDRHRPRQSCLASFVNGSHSTVRNQGQDFIFWKKTNCILQTWRRPTRTFWPCGIAAHRAREPFLGRQAGKPRRRWCSNRRAIRARNRRSQQFQLHIHFGWICHGVGDSRAQYFYITCAKL